MRDLRYSDLLMLNGAGASKACGLPDMRQFAQLFREQVRSLDDVASPTLDLLDDILSRDDEPVTDLEGLMTALTSLSGEVQDPAAELLLRNAALSERNLASSVERLSDYLGEWTTMAPLTAGPYQIITKGAVFPISGPILSSPSLALDASGLISRPVRDSPLTATRTDIGGITRDRVDKHRASLSAARQVLDDWKGYFAGLKPAAAELLKRLKSDIQNTYSTYKARPAGRSYRPLLNELLRRFPYLDVFTLNYDMVVEGVLSSSRHGCFTGFRTSGNREWHNAFPSPVAPKGSVRLYKLHGSVNWFQMGRKVIELPAGITSITTSAGAAQNMLIYPITQKLVYGEPHLTLFHHFARALRAARLCLIIGCSLRDDLVSSTLAFAARDRPDLRFIFCGSPDAVAANTWLKPFSRRFLVMERRFGDDAFLTELKGILDTTV